MENTERHKFEQTWQEALAGAEQTPSEGVWMSIERTLAVTEGGVMKRRVVFYQRLAATAVLFALALGTITTYYYLGTQSSETTGTLSGTQPVNPPVSSPNPVADANDQHPETIQPSGKGIGSGNRSEHRTIEQSTPLLAAWDDEDESTPDQENHSAGKKSVLRSGEITWLSLSEIESADATVHNKLRSVTIVRKLPAMPASFMAETRKKNEAGENIWAAVGAAAGSYSPQMSSNTQAQAATGLLSNQVTSDASNKGSAYSLGFNMGAKLSDRWVLQGGFSYLNQAIGYTSNIASMNTSNQSFATVADYAVKSQNNYRYTVTNPYEINSVNEYVSIPVQAGYLVVNRKAGVQINSGLATDIFLRNTLTDKSGQLDSYSEGAGNDSPYRTVSWSALMGTELSYRLGSQYRVALVPGLRYSLSPVLKSDAASTPLVWDLGFRFRYIFK